MSDEREQLEAYARRWAQYGPILEEIRRRELREFDGVANRHIVLSLLDLGAPAITRLPPRTTSGLVEQQRLFAKLRR